MFRLVHREEQPPPKEDEILCLELEEFQVPAIVAWAQRAAGSLGEVPSEFFGAGPLAIALTRPGKVPSATEQYTLTRAGVLILEVPDGYWATPQASRPRVLEELFRHKLPAFIEPLAPKVERQAFEDVRIFDDPPVQLDEQGRRDLLRRMNEESREVD